MKKSFSRWSDHKLSTVFDLNCSLIFWMEIVKHFAFVKKWEKCQHLNSSTSSNQNIYYIIDIYLYQKISSFFCIEIIEDFAYFKTVNIISILPLTLCDDPISNCVLWNGWDMNVCKCKFICVFCTRRSVQGSFPHRQ